MEISELIGRQYKAGEYSFEIAHATENSGVLFRPLHEGGPEIIIADGTGLFFAFDPQNLEARL